MRDSQKTAPTQYAKKHGENHGQNTDKNTVGLRPPWSKGVSGNPGGRPKMAPLSFACRELLVQPVPDGGYQNYPIVSPYLEDQWKATRKLTLTLGMRYLYSPNASWFGKNANLYSNFVPALYNPAEAPIVTPGGTITATPNYNPMNGIAFLGTPDAPKNYSDLHKNYWNPQFGFAYDVFGDGKTSIRGGYGITHQQTLEAGCQPPCLNNPPSITISTLFKPPFPNSTGGAPTPPTPLTIQGESTGFRDPMIQTYSLGVERQFGQWFASISGAGNIVTKAVSFANINQPVPEGGFDFNPIINTGSVSQYASSLAGPAPYQGFGSVQIFQNLGYSNWNALEVNVKHPVGHGVFFSAAYTWQHGLSAIATAPLSGQAGFQNIYDVHADYGTTMGNVAQILAISAIWNIPLFRNSEGLKKTLLGGWSYSDITTIQTGFTLDPGLAISNAGLATRPNRVPGTHISYPKTVHEWFNTAAFAAPAPGFFGNAGNGSIVGPGLVNFDMALYKDFAITERQKFQFRAEFFNIFNHTNFNSVQTAFGAGNFGQVTSARDPRIMEFALRYEF